MEARRAAAVHTLFNIAGVLVWVMFIPQLVEIVAAISPAAPELSGKARMAAEVPRQIANAHTIFNVANTLLFIGFTGVFARLVERLVPEKAVEEKTIVEPKFLDTELVEVPSMALERVRFEIGHMGKIIGEMMSGVQTAWRQRDRAALDMVLKMDDKVDILHQAILQYLGDIRRETLTDRQTDEFQALMTATVNLESLADVIESELVGLGKRAIDIQLEQDETTHILFVELTDMVEQAVAQVIRAIREADQQAAEAVINVKDEVRRLADEALARQSTRIGVAETGNIDQIRLEFEVLDNLRRIYTIAKRIAKDFVPREVAEKA